MTVILTTDMTSSVLFLDLYLYLYIEIILLPEFVTDESSYIFLIINFPYLDGGMSALPACGI